MLGNKQFELSNLPIAIGIGNVLTTVSDRKLPHTSDNITIDYYTSDITSAQDYYAFGQLMPGRNFSSNTYKFGFNGQKKDDEISGITGRHYEFKFREYDSYIGRLWSVDPIANRYPWNSTYAFAENDVIRCKDLEGLEKVISTIIITPNNTLIQIVTVSDINGPLGDGVMNRVADFSHGTPTFSGTYTSPATVNKNNQVTAGSTYAVPHDVAFPTNVSYDPGTLSQYVPNVYENIKNNLAPAPDDQGFTTAAKIIGSVVYDMADDAVKLSTGFVNGPSYASDLAGHGISPSEYTKAGMNTLINLSGNLISEIGQGSKLLNASEFSSFYKGENFLKGGNRGFKMARENNATRQLFNSIENSTKANTSSNFIQQLSNDNAGSGSIPVSTSNETNSKKE